MNQPRGDSFDILFPFTGEQHAKMSMPLAGNQKFSGLIKVNFSRDSNEKQIVVNENPLRTTVTRINVVQCGPSKTATTEISPTKVVRIVDNSALPSKKPKMAVGADDSNGIPGQCVGRAYDIAPFPDEPEKSLANVAATNYELPEFVVGKSQAPKKSPPERLGVETIVPNVCFHFLNDQCRNGDDCQESHVYPNEKEVFTKLQAIGWINAAKLFRAVVSRCPSLLRNYFTVFARFFAGKRQREPLIDMLAVCEDPRNRIVTRLGKLVKAFVFSGLTYSQTVAIMLKNHRRTTSTTLSIIFNTDIVSDASTDELLKGLELLSADPEFDFDVFTVNHLLSMSCEIGTIKMIKLMIKIFDRLKLRRPAAMAGIDQKRFKQFFEVYESCTEQVECVEGKTLIRAP